MLLYEEEIIDYPNVTRFAKPDKFEPSRTLLVPNVRTFRSENPSSALAAQQCRRRRRINYNLLGSERRKKLRRAGILHADTVCVLWLCDPLNVTNTEIGGRGALSTSVLGLA